MGGNWQKRQGCQRPIPCSTCSIEQCGRAMDCETYCKPMYVRLSVLVGCSSLMKRAFSRRGRSQPGYSANIAEQQDALKLPNWGLLDICRGDHTFVDRELYLPKSWTQDPERCKGAHVPEEVGFATKPELAARMLWRTLDAGLTASWVTGDTVYGSHRPLREGLEKRSQAYALAVA